MMRMALFIFTNLAVLLVVSVVLKLTGLDRALTAQMGVPSMALLVYCGLFGMTGAFISLLLSKWMAKRTTGTEVITQAYTPQQHGLLHTVRQLANEAGIAMPEVGIFPAQEANAFATGWNKNAALVAVSQGLLDRFSEHEVRAVLAHEIGHVANGDMVTLTLIQGVVNTFVLFFARIIGFAVDRALSRGESQHRNGLGYYVGTFVAEIFLGVLASMVVAKFSRWREFRADYAGAQLAGKHAMMSALQRLQVEAQHTGPSQMPASLSALGVSSGLGNRLLSAFASHPPLEVRIQALSRLAMV